MKTLSVSHKYAQALFNIYGSDISREDIQAIREMRVYLGTHRRIAFFLNIAAIPDDIKEQGLSMLCERFGAYKTCKELIELLKKHNRLVLFAEILYSLEGIYLEQEHFMPVKVTSPVPLLQNDRKILEQFLTIELQGTVECDYQIDKQLIAGIRVQSRYHLWEHSVLQRLRTMQHVMNYHKLS